MYPLFESIAILDGDIKNQEWHQKRFLKSYDAFYNESPSYGLFDQVVLDKQNKEGTYKLRISYNKLSTRVEISPYESKKIQSLQVVQHNTIDYKLKYQDRVLLSELYECRRSCDDVLIVKNNLITDSSYANIVFSDGNHWYTPDQPLLKGTARARLIKEGVITELEIKLSDLSRYKSFKLVNALRNFEEVEEVSVQKILF